MNSIKNIRLTGLEPRDIMFKNFSGRPDKYNSKGGVRNFCVRINNEDDAHMLNEIGWNIKVLAPRNPDEVPVYYLPVGIRFDYYPPKIYQHCGRVTTQLDEDNIATLDDADITSVDIEIRPYTWERNGDGGVKAYVKIMHVVVEQDPFAAKYAAEESPEDDVPWK